MTNTPNTPNALQPVLPDITPISHLADRHATAHLFADYRQRTALNTVTRQDDDLAAFSDFLLTVKVKRSAAALSSDSAAWHGITWGMVKAFVGYLLNFGFAVGSINVRLSTIKMYASLSCQAGAISAEELLKIKGVRGYSRREAGRLDAGREQTRVSTKKAEGIVLDNQTAQALRDQPPTLQGLRDSVAVQFMLDMGLRVGEVVGLKIESLDMDGGRITFYREKVDKQQTHALPRGLAATLKPYLLQLSKAGHVRGPLVRGVRKNGKPATTGMQRFAIAKRIRALGDAVGQGCLSPHDLRHTWATHAARAGVPIDKLRDAGGWASINTPLAVYVKPAAIANQGVLDVMNARAH